MADDQMRNAGRFGARSTALEVVAGHDLRGKNIIVTGGASGIGIETVRAFASAGARVAIATRDAVVAESVAARLRQETGNPAIEVGVVDLMSLASIRAYVKSFLALHRPLHILVNNAGIGSSPLAYTKDGFESAFGTNHVGHFALTTGLLPALKAAGKARVVMLSSLGLVYADVDLDDPNFTRRPYDPKLAYDQSKTANALFAVELTRRHAQDGITANAVHPGGVYPTGLQKHLTREQVIARGFIDSTGKLNPNFKTAEQGAATSVWAAVAPELDGIGGLFLDNCAISIPIPGDPRPIPAGTMRPLTGHKAYALDPVNARRLWTVTEELIAGKG